MKKMNRWQRKQQEKIDKLHERSYDSLSDREKLELAYYKYERFPREEKITYDEFIMLCTVDDSVEFYYKEKGYGVGYELNNLKKRILFIGVDYKDGKCTWEKEEIYSSLDELLEQVRIDGKTIKEIWDEVNC